MNDLGLVVTSAHFAVGSNGQPLLHGIALGGREIEKPQGHGAAVITDIADQHALAAIDDLAGLNFGFYGAVAAGSEAGYGVDAGSVFVAQRQVEQQILYRVDSELVQFLSHFSGYALELGDSNKIQSLQTFSTGLL